MKFRTRAVLRRIALPRHRRSIIVASMGRSGSTLLFDAIVDATTRAIRPSWRVRRQWIADQCWDLRTLRPVPAVVYKSHDFPEHVPARASPRLDVVFVHGDVPHAVASVHRQYERHGPAWLACHYSHLRSSAVGLDDLYRFDAIRARDQLERWSGETRLRLCIVAYEALWERQRELGEFLNLPLRLPERRARDPGTHRILQSHRSRIEEVYREAIRLQRSAPAFAIRRGSS